eukprot:g1950.t1
MNETDGQAGVPVIFLDVDGVLLPFGGADAAAAGAGSTRFCPQALHALSTILTEVPTAVICLSSTWRCNGGQGAIIEQFQSCRFSGAPSPLAGISAFQHTTSIVQHDHRQWEIANWLETTDVKVKSWVALDDEELVAPTDPDDSNSKYRDMFVGHVVKTNSAVGLTHRQAKAAIAILRGDLSLGSNPNPSSRRGLLAAPALPILSLNSKPHLDKNVCRHWWRKGLCRMGSACRFLHPPRASLPRVPRRKYRQQTRNAGRMGIFRRWVVHTFGTQALAEGAGVLDVAAGKGVLAFELENVHGITCTVVDPRPLQLARNVKLWGGGFYHRVSKLSRLAEGGLIHYDPPASASTLPRMPKHIRGFFEPALWRPLFLAEEGDGGPAALQNAAVVFASNLKRAEDTLWTKKGLAEAGHEDESKSAAGENEEVREACQESNGGEVRKYSETAVAFWGCIQIKLLVQL